MPNHWHLCGAHSCQADSLAHDAGNTARTGALDCVALAVSPLAAEDQVHRGCSSHERVDRRFKSLFAVAGADAPGEQGDAGDYAAASISW